MAEQIYTIPVNDAFDSGCECPMCQMINDLERNAIEYTMGPSYMEDDNRALTDEMGFCEKHIQDLYLQKNRLGLALILSTHMAKVTKDLQKLSKENTSTGKSLFKKHITVKVGKPISYELPSEEILKQWAEQICEYTGYENKLANQLKEKVDA